LSAFPPAEIQELETELRQRRARVEELLGQSRQPS
jgi:hypothetical protein